MININMRCIEIKLAVHKDDYILRLTLTWDVLKCEYYCKGKFGSNWLTLTWDVLKFSTAFCDVLRPLGLTLTWDVLKFNAFASW